MLQAVRFWSDQLPFFVPVFLFGLIVAGLLTAPLARWMRLPAFVVFGLLASVALILAATVPPDALRGASQPICKMRVAHLLPELGSLTDARALNTALFAPLGFFVALAAIRGKPWLIAVALPLSITVEAVQLKWSVLGRGCEMQDVVDNMWGLLIGAAAGVVVGLLMARDDGPALPSPRA